MTSQTHSLAIHPDVLNVAARRTQFAEHVLLTIEESWIEKKNEGAAPLLLPDGPYFSAVKEFLNDPETLVHQAWETKCCHWRSSQIEEVQEVLLIAVEALYW